MPQAGVSFWQWNFGDPNSLQQNVINYAWATNAFADPDVIQETPNFQTPEPGRWISLTATGMSDHPAWAWRQAQGEMVDNFAAIRRAGRLFEGIPVFDSWAATFAAGKSA